MYREFKKKNSLKTVFRFYWLSLVAKYTIHSKYNLLWDLCALLFINKIYIIWTILSMYNIIYNMHVCILGAHISMISYSVA